jgi:signal transduction histidine kinase
MEMAAAPPETRDERIVVLAPLGRDAAILASACESQRLCCLPTSGPEEVVRALEDGAGVIVVTEEVLVPPAARVLVDALRAQPAWSDIPVIVLTSADRTAEPSALTVKSLEGIGNVTLLERPVRIMTLFSTIRSGLRARRRQYEVRDYLVERARIERQLHERAQEMELASRAKDEFLAMLGHELRNPLGAIGSAAHLLDRVGTHDSRAVRPLEVILRQVDHLSRLVDDLLDVSRVTMGKVVLDRRPLDVAQSVARCVALMRSAQKMDRHTVHVSTEPVWASADETRVEQIAGNLLVNALKYTPEGGEIHVSVRAENDAAVIQVQDNGVGLSPSLLPRVFDPFVQGERDMERAQGGLGIGLTLVRRLAELHGGTVQAASDGPGRGSTFTVRLPAIGRPALAAAPARNGDGVPTGLKILLVEDNEDSREMMRHLLRMSGHEVHEAADGVSGVATALAISPDVAIIDVGLPGLSGFEVASRLRRTPEGRQMSLVALTGYGQPEDRDRAFNAGFDSFLVKPVEPEQLQRALIRRR